MINKILVLLAALFSGAIVADSSKFAISSMEFNDKELIPIKYSFKQQNISPALSWSGAPKKTQSYALVMIDYDAKQTVGHPVVHWVVYNIPKDITELYVAENRFAMGLNSYGKLGYIGMNPPKGQKHNYHFYLYALAVPELEFESAPTAEELLNKIQNNLLATASMIGIFVQ